MMTSAGILKCIHDELRYLKLNDKFKGYHYLYDMIEGMINGKIGLHGTYLPSAVYEYVKTKKPMKRDYIRATCDSVIKRAYKNNEKLYEDYFKFPTRPSVYDVVITVLNKVSQKRYMNRK